MLRPAWGLHTQLWKTGGRSPEQHSAYISNLWLCTTQRHRWPVTILGAAALSGINTRGSESSSDLEGQGRLLGEGGLGSKVRKSAAAKSRSPYPLRLHESSLPLTPEKPKAVLPKPPYVLPRAGQWRPGEESVAGLAPRSGSLAWKMDSNSVGSYRRHRKCLPHFLLS